MAPENGGSRTWQKEPFKKYREDYQAALFTYGLKQPAPDYEWQYSSGEMPDYNREADCFVRCRVNGEFFYKPVQLKEVVPAEWPDSGLQQVIDRLGSKYTATAGQETLVVAIHVNRAMTINFKELRVPPNLHIQQLWLYGQTDEMNGFVVGDLLSNPSRYNFALPTFEPGALLSDGFTVRPREQGG